MAFTEDQPTPSSPQQSSLAQDDATGVDKQVTAQGGGIDEFGVNFDQVVSARSGFAQPDLGMPSTGSIFDKNGLGVDITDPSAMRLKMSGLLPGGARANQKKDPRVEYRTDRKGVIGHDSDWRVRVTLAKSANIFYQQDGADASLMAPLVKSGVIFPYTPQISVTHVANYESQGLTHANYQSYFYRNSEVQQISIAGDFTAQNHDEARYVLAVLYFFRAATKMFYGDNKGNKNSQVGSPPPIVFLNGYGKYYFPNVPCVITSFQHTMPDDVDYIPVIPTAPTANIATAKERRLEETRIPTSSRITISLQPIYSRKNIYDNFSLDDFAQGKLLGNKVRGSGGFI